MLGRVFGRGDNVLSRRAYAAAQHAAQWRRDDAVSRLALVKWSLGANGDEEHGDHRGATDPSDRRP